MARAPKFADPEHPARVGYTKLTKPVGFSPRAVSGASKFGSAEKPLTPGKAKRPPSDKIAAMPGKNSKPRDLLRGIGSRRVR